MQEVETEIWRVLPEHPKYQVSNLGRVKGPKGLLSPSPNKGGHLSFSVWLPEQNKSKCIGVHKAVCTLFNGPAPLGKPYALHNDHNPGNCAATNLHWGSAADNSREMVAADRSCAGKRNPNARFTEEQVLEMKALRAKDMSWGDIGVKFQTSGQSARAAVLGWKDVQNAGA